MENQTILCVGTCVLDVIHVCETFPEEDSDKRTKFGRWQRGGNASNNCTVLSLLGAKCEFIGTFSTEPMFKFVTQDMIDRGIEIRNCVYHENSVAPFSSIILNEFNGTRTIIHSNPNLPILTFNDFDKINLETYKWIHFEARNPNETSQMMEKIIDYNKKFRSTADKKPIGVSLDLEKNRPGLIELSRYADLVFFGKDLAMHLGFKNSKEATYGLRQLIKQYNTKPAIICPWGSEATSLLTSDDVSYSQPASKPTNVKDTLGAGDTFCAGVLYIVAHLGKDINQSLEFASKLAGYKVGSYGYDSIATVYNELLQDCKLL